MNHIFRHAPVAAACATLVIAGVLVGAARPGADPNKDKVRILAWSKDAKLSRKLTEKELAQLRAKRKPGDKKPLPVYKQLTGVRAGSLLEVPDILETRKAQIDIKGGTLVFQRLAPNTVLRYAKIDPTLFVPTTPAQFLMTVDKGSVQMRIGTTKQPSRIQVNGPKTITGAAGTAYSVTVTGQKTTLLVAEGQVEIASEVTPDERVLVGEREKLVFDAGSGAPFPTQAVPVTAADEPAIQALLSLPVIGLNGYSYGRDLRRADAEDIIITRVQQIKQQLDDGSYSSYKPRWGKPDRVYLTGRTDFWTTDGTGARKHAGPGLIFEAISPDGTFIIGSKPNKGLWRVNWNGTGLRQISRQPLGEVRISPNGKRLVAGSGWQEIALVRWNAQKKKYVPTGLKKWVVTKKAFVTLSASGGNEKTLTRTPNKASATPVWKRGGDRLIAFIESFGKGFQFIDGDTNPPAVLVTGTPADDWYGRGQWSVSPMGQWLSGSIGGKSMFIRLSDRKVFRNESGEHPVILMGETTARLASGEVVQIENPEVAPRAFDGGRDQEYPQLSGGVQRAPVIDGSPNGELIAHYTNENLAVISDSVDAARSTITPAAVPRYSQVHWINGYRVLYTDFRGDKRVFIDFGVKRGRSKVRSGDQPSGDANVNARVNFANLLGQDDKAVISRLGKPKESIEFDSFYVLHLMYEPASLGQVRLMFTKAAPEFKRTFLDHVIVGSDRYRSPATWTSLLGLTESDGWQPSQVQPDRRRGTALRNDQLAFTKRMPNGEQWSILFESRREKTAMVDGEYVVELSLFVKR